MRHPGFPTQLGLGVAIQLNFRDKITSYLKSEMTGFPLTNILPEWTCFAVRDRSTPRSSFPPAVRAPPRGSTARRDSPDSRPPCSAAPLPGGCPRGRAGGRGCPPGRSGRRGTAPRWSRARGWGWRRSGRRSNLRETNEVRRSILD